MNLHITIPDPVYKQLLTHIKERFGEGHPGLKSAIITAALNRYIHPELFPGPFVKAKEPLIPDQAP